MTEQLDNKTIQETVSTFDAEAIRSGAAFELLETADDELTLERILSILKARAVSVGIKVGEFTALAKAAKNDLRRKAAEDKKARERAKNAEDLAKVHEEQGTLEGLAEMMTDGVTPDFGSYICTERAVLASGPQGQVYEIIGHPLFPTVRYVNIESGSELLDLSYKLDGRWKKVRLVDRKVISQAKTITALSEYGLDITSENARDVVTYLAEMDKRNRDHILKKETVNHLGWVEGRGFSPYIEDVEYDSGGKFADAYAAVHEHGSFDVWKETAAKIMTDPVCLPARIVLAASVASVLLKWTSGQPFMVHLWSSESGTGKTIAAMLAASVWADPTIGRYMRSMNATKVANEQLAGFCNNLPLILDELQTIQKNADFDDVIYMLCEGTGKARGSRDGGLREQSKWLNTIITNGEQPISTDGRAGAVNRVISIEADGEIIPGGKEGMSEFADTLRENYGHAGRMLVERILETKDYKDLIRIAYNHNMKKLAQEVTGKQANYGAALLVGDAMLCTIIFGGQFTPLRTKDILPYLATAEMVDTNEKIKDWLVGWVVTNIARFRDDRRSDQEEIKGPVYGRIAANSDVMILKTVLAEQMTNRGRVPTAFMRWCDKRGFLCTNHSETNRHWEVWASIPGIEQSSPVYHFRAAMFTDQGKQTPEGTVVNVALPF